MLSLSRAVARGALPHLHRVDLDYNDVGVEGVVVLSKGLKEGGVVLSSLYLEGNSIGDEGMRVMLEEEVLGGVRHLEMGINSLGPPSMALLAGE